MQKWKEYLFNEHWHPSARQELLLNQNTNQKSCVSTSGENGLRLPTCVSKVGECETGLLRAGGGEGGVKCELTYARLVRRPREETHCAPVLSAVEALLIAALALCEREWPHAHDHLDGGVSWVRRRALSHAPRIRRLGGAARTPPRAVWLVGHAPCNVEQMPLVNCNWAQL